MLSAVGVSCFFLIGLRNKISTIAIAAADDAIINAVTGSAGINAFLCAAIEQIYIADGVGVSPELKRYLEEELPL